MKYVRTAQWLTGFTAFMFVLGCAASGQQLTSEGPRKCHASQILSCDVKGHGLNKSYSNCRCEYPREINTGFSNMDM